MFIQKPIGWISVGYFLSCFLPEAASCSTIFSGRWNGKEQCALRENREGWSFCNVIFPNSLGHMLFFQPYFGLKMLSQYAAGYHKRSRLKPVMCGAKLSDGSDFIFRLNQGVYCRREKQINTEHRRLPLSSGCLSGRYSDCL